MKKKNIKALFILAIAFVMTFVLVGCANNKKEEEKFNYVTPSVTEGSKVEFENTNVKVTKDEVYKMVKYYGGVSTLIQMLDEKILTEEIKGMTTEDPFFKSRYNRTVYATTDVDSIEASEKTEMENEFKNTMYLMGYKTEDDINNYIKVLAARDKYAQTYINELTNKKDSLYVTDEKVQAYYEKNALKVATRKAYIINFTSANDYLNTLKNNGYVQFDASFYELDSTISARNFAASENKTEVTDINGAFTNMYNEVYGTTDGEKTYTYADLSKNASTIADKLFSMKTGEYTYMVTPNKVTYGTVYTLIYCTEGEAIKEYSELTEDEKNNYKEEYIVSLTETVSNVSKAMASLRASKGLVINDRAFAYDYYSTYDTNYSYKKAKGSETVLASITGYEITADDFYNYAMKNNPEYYVFYAAIPALQTNVELYSTVYGEEKDINKNASLRKSSYYKTLQEALEKSYNVATYEYEEMYLYRNYGFESIDDIVKYYYMANDLRYLTVLDMLYNVEEDGSYKFNENEYADTFEKLIDDYYDTYYSFKIYDLVLTLDKDIDYVVDDMTTASQTEYQEFYDFMKARITEKTEKSVTDATEVVNKLIKEYNSASRKTNETSPIEGYSNEVEFAKFKSMGITMKLNQIGAATYTSNGSKYSDNFNQALATLFRSDKAPDSSSEMAIADSLVFDENGVHFIYVTYNTKDLSYELVAKTEEKDGETVPVYEYDKAYYNDNKKLSVAQLSTYYVLASFNTLFTDAETALTDFLIDKYPGNAPSTLDFSAYVTALDKYFVSETFVNQYYLDLLKGGKFDTEYAKYAEIYASFMEDIVD